MLSSSSPFSSVQAGHLASFLSRLTQVRRRQRGWWVAGHYDNSSLSWSWDSGERMTFTSWHPLNSHNSLTEHCLALVDDKTLHWLSLPCDGRQDGSIVLEPLCEKVSALVV